MNGTDGGRDRRCCHAPICWWWGEKSERLAEGTNAKGEPTGGVSGWVGEWVGRYGGRNYTTILVR